MGTLVIVVHVIAAMAIIGLILLQQGKGAEMGASFGSGASQTLFGSQGSGNFFSRMTAFIAVIFFVTSFALAVIAKEQASIGDDIAIPAVEELDIPIVEDTAEPQGDVPTVETPAPAAEVPSVETGEPDAAQSETESESDAAEKPQPEQ